MKKINILILTLIITFSFDSQKANAQAVEQGKVVIDAFYGYPYFWGALLKSAYTNSGTSSVRLRNYNHFGGKFEYMASDKIGVGIEYTYALASVNYIDSASGGSYTAGIKKQRILGKLNIHFATTDVIDPYFTVGAGYKGVNIYTTEPGDVTEVNITLLPVAFRAGIGLRYFFTDFIGLNAEVGIGGPVMQAGLSVKF